MADRRRSRRTQNRRRPWEFSKKLAVWAVTAATVSAAASFVLAAAGKETVSDLANTIFTACIGYLITYAAKSTTEKVSRNRHGLDQDGIPFPAAEQPEEQGEPPDMR